MGGLCLLILPCAVLAETSLLKQEQGQQRIGNSTADSAALLAELVDEFGRNGLEGTDVEILEGIQKVMGNVSGELMPEIVSQLNAARTGEDRTGRRARRIPPSNPTLNRTRKAGTTIAATPPTRTTAPRSLPR